MILNVATLTTHRSCSLSALRDDVQCLTDLAVPNVNKDRPYSSPSQTNDANLYDVSKYMYSNRCMGEADWLVDVKNCIEKESNNCEDDVSLREEFRANFSHTIGLKRSGHPSVDYRGNVYSFYSRSVDSCLEAYDEQTYLLNAPVHKLTGAENPNYCHGSMECIDNGRRSIIDGVTTFKSDAAFLVYAMKTSSVEGLICKVSKYTKGGFQMILNSPVIPCSGACRTHIQ